MTFTVYGIIKKGTDSFQKTFVWFKNPYRLKFSRKAIKVIKSGILFAICS